MNISFLDNRNNSGVTKISSLILMGLFFASVLLNYLLPFMRYIMWISGSGLFFLYLTIFRTRKSNIAKEVILYGLFVLWAILTGIIVAVDYGRFFNYVQTVFSIFLLAVSISGFISHFGYFLAFIKIFLVSAFFMDLYSLINGDFYSLFQPFVQYRAIAFLNNPNVFAFINLFAVFSLLILFIRKTKIIFRILEYGLLGIYSLSIIASGSQKTFLGLIILIIGWLWVRYGKSQLKHPPSFLLFIIWVSVLVFSINFALNKTYLGTRFQNTVLGQNASTLERERLLQFGWELFKENPVAGVGLSQFGHYYFSDNYTYSHSDIIELLSTTGFIGFCIYYSIFPVLFFRLNRLKKKNNTHQFYYDIEIIKIFIIMIIVVSTAMINFLTTSTWFFLSGIIGYTYWMERNIKASNTAPINIVK